MSSQLSLYLDESSGGVAVMTLQEAIARRVITVNDTGTALRLGADFVLPNGARSLRLSLPESDAAEVQICLGAALPQGFRALVLDLPLGSGVNTTSLSFNTSLSDSVPAALAEVQRIRYGSVLLTRRGLDLVVLGIRRDAPDAAAEVLFSSEAAPEAFFAEGDDPDEYYCSYCRRAMGACNPRQLCCKSFCPKQTSYIDAIRDRVLAFSQQSALSDAADVAAASSSSLHASPFRSVSRAAAAASWEAAGASAHEGLQGGDAADGDDDSQRTLLPPSLGGNEAPPAPRDVDNSPLGQGAATQPVWGSLGGSI